MSWGDFKPLLADAVSNEASVLQCSMYRLLASPPSVPVSVLLHSILKISA